MIYKEVIWWLEEDGQRFGPFQSYDDALKKSQQRLLDGIPKMVDDAWNKYMKPLFEIKKENKDG